MQEFPKSAIDAALAEARFDPREVPPEEVPVFTIQDRSIGTLGNYVAVTGKPKVGKTLFLSAILGSAYVPYSIWDCKLTLPDTRRKIAYFDTEQSRYAFYRLMNRVKTHIGMDNIPSHIVPFLLRKFDPSIIIPMIDRVLQDAAISIVFIDGLLDLCRNYNDERESFEVIQFLKKTSQERNILIIGVIHQSKREAYSLGHLGSAVDRYAESTLSIEKDDSKKFITLSAGLLRNTIDEFTPITIMWNGSDFERSDVDLKAKKIKDKDKGPHEYTETQHKYFLNNILPTDGLIYDDLVIEICQGRGISKQKAKDFIRHYVAQQLLIKGQDKLYKQTASAKVFAVKN